MSTNDRMNQLDRLPADLVKLEAELAALQPRSDSLNRDRLMFEAGRASVSARGYRLWPIATAAMTTVAAGLAALLVFQPPPRVVERVKLVEIERMVPVSPREENSPQVTPPPSESPSMSMTTTATEKPGQAVSIIPRAGTDFRLFEHLIGETTVPVGMSAPVDSDNDDSEVLSPRSLPKLLKVSRERHKQNV